MSLIDVPLLEDFGTINKLYRHAPTADESSPQSPLQEPAERVETLLPSSTAFTIIYTLLVHRCYLDLSAQLLAFTTFTSLLLRSLSLNEQAIETCKSETEDEGGMSRAHCATRNAAGTDTEYEVCAALAYVAECGDCRSGEREHGVVG